jgi:hypothetical protein
MIEMAYSCVNRSVTVFTEIYVIVMTGKVIRGWL